MEDTNNGNMPFVYDELTAALKEHSFGIKNFKIVSWTAQEAHAHVTTLESNRVTVSLTNAGFKVTLNNIVVNFNMTLIFHRHHLSQLIHCADLQIRSKMNSKRYTKRSSSVCAPSVLFTRLHGMALCIPSSMR